MCSNSLSSLLDRELDRNELIELRAHLADCPDCCKELALFCCDAAAVSLQSLPPAAVGLWCRVVEALGLPSEDVQPDTNRIMTPGKDNVVDLGQARARLSRAGRK